MAYAPTQLRLIVPSMGNSGSPQIWSLDGVDAIATVGSTANFISDAEARGVRKGDLVVYRKWDSVSTKATYEGTAQFVIPDTSSSGASMRFVEGGGEPASATIVLAASATTDGMDITITITDRDGAVATAPVGFEWWISEDATGIGLTADTYSGTVTAGTGAILTALTAKKHFLAVTDDEGSFVATAVDSGNPVDQYVVVKLPNGSLIVSVASADNWEGA
jgi:hypothetical protein